jgi:hypothetical protein
VSPRCPVTTVERMIKSDPRPQVVRHPTRSAVRMEEPAGHADRCQRALMQERNHLRNRQRRGRGRKMTHDPMHPSQEPEQLRQAARFGARTRSGTPCRSPAVTGRRRCRMHGGAAGSGGPKGPRNGNYKHGRYTAEVIASRRWLRQCILAVRALTNSPEHHFGRCFNSTCRPCPINQRPASSAQSSPWHRRSASS